MTIQEKEFLISINRRFESIYISWNNAYNNYFNIDLFLININSAIQELRNITFLLQSNKSLYPDFDNWYSNKQDKMKKDKHLRRIIDSRNRIVKQSDLEINSIAYVSLLNWLECKFTPIKLNPFLSNEEMISIVSKLTQIKELQYAAQKLQMPLLKIEKKRIDKEYEDIEILILIQYWFDYFSTLINEFLKLINIEHSFKKINVDGLYKKQCYFLDMNDWSVISHTEIDMKDKIIWNKEIMKKVEKMLWDIKFDKTEDPIDDVIMKHITIAKTIITNGETHKPLAVYLSSDYRPIKYVFGAFEDQVTKYAWIRWLAAEIKNNENIYGILLINEAYIVALENYQEYKKNPSLETAKEECLVIIFLNREWISNHISIPIYRKKWSITFWEKKIEKEIVSILNPIKESWGIKTAK